MICGRDRALSRRRDALFEYADVGAQRRLVAHRRGHAAHKRRDFGSCLEIAEDVVHEEQHVGAELVAKIFRHRDAGLCDAKAYPGRFVHLSEHERRLR